MIKKWMAFAKKETVLCAALALALISSCLVLPDREYLGYIDFRTLAILFGLMSVMAGLQKAGVFQYIAEGMLRKVKDVRQLVLILVFLCFFFSMAITNDVALITFVPFTFTVLKLLDQDQADRLLIPVVVMQTIAANLGSMLTPIGNPQNLYLYGKAGMGPGEFLLLMLPFTAVSFLMLTVWCLCQGGKAGQDKGAGRDKGTGQDGTVGGNKKTGALTVSFGEAADLNGRQGKILVYLILFAVCLLTVAHILPYGVMLAIVAGTIVIMDRQVLTRVDYSLLLTFVGFFIFIGNMGRMEAFRRFLEGIISGNEVVTAVASSQLISNVPAALLLSGFSSNYKALIVGTNLGGLGTLIASMASLISFKYIAKEDKNLRGRYLGYFTAANVVFLAILMAVEALLF